VNRDAVRLTKGDNVDIVFGFLMGLLTAIALFGFLTYWLCSRSNNMVVAKFINGIAQALAHKSESAEAMAPGRNGEAKEEAAGTRKEKARET